MGCCGCTLFASTITAGVLTILDCLGYLAFDAFVLSLLTHKNEPSIDTDDFTNTILSFYKINGDTKTILIALVAIKLAIRAIWFISAIVLFIGNSKELSKCLKFWQIITTIRIIYSIGVCVYVCVKFADDLKEISDKGIDELQGKPIFAELIVIIDFIEFGGPIWWIILLALIIYVYQRDREINNQKRQLSHANNWGNFVDSYDANNQPPPPTAPVNSGGDTNNNNNKRQESLTNRVSLTQPPKTFTISGGGGGINREDNNNDINSGKQQQQQPELSTDSINSAQPILQVNNIISIPRVSLNKPQPPPKPQQQNARSNYDNNNTNNRHQQQQQPYGSSLAQRSSYLDAANGAAGGNGANSGDVYYQQRRVVDNIPKRTDSYHMAQGSSSAAAAAGAGGQRSRNYYSYDNRGYQRTENNEFPADNQSGLVKRTSFRH
ncbi:uncharacterized protein DDB_G0283357-like [Oppia nitens]|uniref:uncharacterized protein DDB_G0283357-like n=1 Tax=Oppia nitens TaxID=1686743 RepID=UPI0023D97DCB|nr:uncharacterized protein DDB_G0283357-like [Oppia nitens]